jgi:hypothetical protein
MKQLFTKMEEKFLLLVMVVGAIAGVLEAVGLVNSRIVQPICAGDALVVTSIIIIGLSRTFFKCVLDK